MGDRDLSRADKLTFAERLAELLRGRYPLVHGLKLAAREPSSRVLKNVFAGLARALEAGTSWRDLDKLPGNPIPPHVLAAIEAGVDHDAVADMLDQLVLSERTRRELSSRALRAMIYPALVCLLLVAVIALQAVFLANSFVGVGDDTEFALMSKDNEWHQWSFYHTLFLSGTFGILAAVLLLVRILGGKLFFTRLLYMTPLLGPLRQWIGTLEWLQLVHLLVKKNVPLSQGLRLVVPGLSSPELRSLSLSLADRVDQGNSWGAACGATDRVTAEIKPIMTWGDKNHCLPDALEACSEILRERIDARLTFLKEIVGPVAFLCLLAMVGSVIVVFIPMWQLTWSLTNLF